MKESVLAVIILLSSFLPEKESRISINIPTAKEEAAYIWRTIYDIQFFEENNYQISLPNSELIDELKLKSRSGSLSDLEYERLEKFIIDNIYDESDYQNGYIKIKNELPLIDKMINQLSAATYNWKFKEIEIYQVNLTLYGPGGSYNPEDGSILIFTSPDGQFKSYNNPSNTIIHEVVHIGIEESIITKYNVPHPLKERIVDTFVSLHFGDYLTEYRIQDMGDYRIDPYLKEISDLEFLDKIIQKILPEN